MEIRTGLALALQRVRERQELTQAEAAARIGTLQAQVSKMEAGQSAITIDRLIKALAALGVSKPAIVRAMGRAA